MTDHAHICRVADLRSPDSFVAIFKTTDDRWHIIPLPYDRDLGADEHVQTRQDACHFAKEIQDHGISLFCEEPGHTYAARHIGPMTVVRLREVPGLLSKFPQLPMVEFPQCLPPDKLLEPQYETPRVISSPRLD